MAPQDLKTGRVYIQVSYSDPESTIPAVDPMVYLGENVLEPQGAERSDKTWFVFQDPHSFSSVGSAAEVGVAVNLGDDDTGINVYSLMISDLDAVFDFAGMVDELKRALARASI